MKDGLGDNRRSGENSWKAFAGVQPRGSCGLDFSGGTRDGETWLCCRYTLEVESMGLGDG